MCGECCETPRSRALVLRETNVRSNFSHDIGQKRVMGCEGGRTIDLEVLYNRVQFLNVIG